MSPQAVADPLDALAAQHGAIVAAGADPLDALAQQHGAITANFKTSNEKDAEGNAVVNRSSAAPNFAGPGAALGGDFVLGAAKGAGETLTHLGSLALHTPVLGKFLHAANQQLYGLTPEQQEAAFASALDALKATNWAQKIGKGTEQVAEVIAPANAIRATGMKVAAEVAPRLTQSLGPILSRALPRAIVEGAGSAAIAKAQGGNPIVGGVLGAAAPVVGEAVDGLPASLKEQAEKRVVQALGPTKERFKTIANRLAPQILARGLGGSRQSLQQKAADTLETVGEQIDNVLNVKGSQPISVQPVHDALEAAKDAFRTPNTQTGKMIELEPRAIRQLAGLQKVVSDLGPTSTVEQMLAVRKAWDKVVDQAGGFAHRAGGAIGVPLKDQSEAFAKREGASAIRQLLAADVPDLAALNKEYSFWKGLDDVLTQTLQRTQPQARSLVSHVAETGGNAMAAASGAGPAVISGKVMQAVHAVVSSPRWQFASAKMRDRLADALMNGNAGQIFSTISQIGAVQSSKIPALVSEASPQ